MRKGLEDYVVPFSSLKPGRYEYDFKVNDSFFAHFEQSEVTAGNLDVRLELQRQTVMLALAFEITGTVNLPCDRCGENYDQDVECKRRMVIHLGGEPQDDEDDITRDKLGGRWRSCASKQQDESGGSKHTMRPAVPAPATRENSSSSNTTCVHMARVTRVRFLEVPEIHLFEGVDKEQLCTLFYSCHELQKMIDEAKKERDTNTAH